jgi:Zn-dependent peptidase ImmA (M78 family)
MSQALSFYPAPPGASSPEAAARAMLSRFWDGRLPVDPAKIAEAAGLDVEFTNPFQSDYGTWSGYFNASQRKIRINGMEAPVRRRFTLAHELGHYALSHGPAFRDEPNAFSSQNRDPREREANQFAAELLMPADAVRKIVGSGTVRSTEDLAGIFHVSKVAMAYRVSNLGMPL